MNATDLRATIKAYAETDFPQVIGSGGLTSTQQLDTFITQAEQRIYNTVDLPLFRKSASGTLTSGNQYVSTPADWLADFSFAVVLPSGDYEYLIFKEPNFIRQAYPNPATTGVPKYYALFDENTFVLGPTPNSNYTVDFHYFGYPVSIVTSGTSWLGDNFDSVLLYGALLETAVFLRAEPDVVQNYTARYQEALGMLKNLGEIKNRTDAYRNVRIIRPLP